MASLVSSKDMVEKTTKRSGDNVYLAINAKSILNGSEPEDCEPCSTIDDDGTDVTIAG